MSADPPLSFGSFRLDPANQCLWRTNEQIALTPKAWGVLHYLVTHPAQLVTKNELLEAVWPETYVTEAVLKVCIGELRKVLGDTAKASQFIQTVHRRGYRFIAAVHSSTFQVQRSKFQVPSSTFQVPGSQSQPSPSPHSPLPHLVGRESELQHLHRCLDQAKAGTRQVVFVTGEAGIGKTTLVEAFAAQLLTDDLPWIGRGQCIEHYGQGEAYLPILEALGRLCRSHQGEQILHTLRRYAPTWLVQLPAVLDPDEREALQRELPAITQQRMLREMAETLEVLSQDHPLVFILEDLHWTDYSTLDLLAALAQRKEPARLLLIGTYRPVDVILSEHPLKSLKQELDLHKQCTELPLEAFSLTHIDDYLDRRFPDHCFPEELPRLLYQRTDGNPLFVVNGADTLVSHGVIVQEADTWQLQGEVTAIAVEVPENLRQLITRHVSHLRPDEQQVLETASVVGGEFATAAVSAALEAEDLPLEQICESLARRGPFLQAVGIQEWPDGTLSGHYRFTHTLYREVLYQQLLATRRMRFHRRIGLRLETAYGAAASTIATELAVHFEEGREYHRALQPLQQVAQTAIQRGANHEALAALTKALTLLSTLPDTRERAQQELALCMALGPVLIAIKGNAAPDVEQTYTRARELCHQLGETTQLFPALFGLRSYYLMWGEIQAAHNLGTELLDVAQQAEDQDWLIEAHVALSSTFFLSW